MVWDFINSWPDIAQFDAKPWKTVRYSSIDNLDKRDFGGYGSRLDLSTRQ
jgi:hypothetical protein